MAIEISRVLSFVFAIAASMYCLCNRNQDTKWGKYNVLGETLNRFDIKDEAIFVKHEPNLKLLSTLTQFVTASDIRRCATCENCASPNLGFAEFSC